MVNIFPWLKFSSRVSLPNLPVFQNAFVFPVFFDPYASVSILFNSTAFPIMMVAAHNGAVTTFNAAKMFFGECKLARGPLLFFTAIFTKKYFSNWYSSTLHAACLRALPSGVSNVFALWTNKTIDHASTVGVSFTANESYG